MNVHYCMYGGMAEWLEHWLLNPYFPFLKVLTTYTSYFLYVVYIISMSTTAMLVHLF